jgi:hypothetical protein
MANKPALERPGFQGPDAAAAEARDPAVVERNSAPEGQESSEAVPPADGISEQLRGLENSVMSRLERFAAENGGKSRARRCRTIQKNRRAGGLHSQFRKRERAAVRRFFLQ